MSDAHWRFQVGTLADESRLDRKRQAIDPFCSNPISVVAPDLKFVCQREALCPYEGGRNTKKAGKEDNYEPLPA